MARFKKMMIAGTSDRTDGRPPDPAASDWPGKTVVAVARAAVRELPALAPAESDRLAGLLRQKVAADSPGLATEAIEAAAMLRCQVPFTTAEQDRKTVGHVARFLVWSAFGGVVDPKRAFTKANVDEYLAATATQ
ncbi:hypothetical protein, partial [Mycobacterium marinum]